MELNPGNARESRKARGHSTLFLLLAFFLFFGMEHRFHSSNSYIHAIFCRTKQKNLKACRLENKQNGVGKFSFSRRPFWIPFVSKQSRCVQAREAATMGKQKKERAGKEARQQAAPMHEFQMST
jgi:hypothetical protein